MLRVYLAGAVRGAHGGWREQIPDIPSVTFLHPGARLPGPHEERQSEIYGPADRLAVRACDVLLAHCDRLEGGHGTAVEIGMALALGKEVFVVCPTEDARFVWRFAVAATPNVFTTLAAAIEALRYAAAQVSGRARCDAGLEARLWDADSPVER